MKQYLIIIFGLLLAYPVGLSVGYIFGLTVERFEELKIVEHGLIFALGIIIINIGFRVASTGVWRRNAKN